MKAIMKIRARVLIPAVVLSLVLVMAAGASPAKGVTGDIDCTTQSYISQSDCEALMDLYNSTGGPSWTSHTGWGTDTDPCDWAEVACTRPVIEGLYLDGNNLDGTLPASLTNLTTLQVLTLNDNLLTGSLPSGWDGMDSLTVLNLSFNDLSGDLPADMGGMAAIEQLFLNGNDFSGPMPDGLGSSDQLLILDVNANADMNGAVPESYTSLNLMYFDFTDTGVCEPQDSTFLTWTETITDYYSGDPCGPDAPVYIGPADGIATTYQTLNFRWNQSLADSNYNFQISDDIAFGSTLHDVETGDLNVQYGPLPYGDTYYWRVRAADGTNWGDWGETWSVRVDKDKWEPNDTQGTAVGNFDMSSQYQQYVQGYVNSLTDQDWFSYYIENGQCVRFWINMQYRTRSYDSADMQIVIYKPDGSLLKMNNDGGAYNDPALKVCFTETGTYTLRVKLEKGALPAADADKTYQLLAQWLDVPTLSAPADGSSTTDRTPTLSWQAVDLAQRYDIQVATNQFFTPAAILHNYSVNTLSSDVPSALPSGGVDYFWRVRARNLRNIGDWSDVWTFTVQ